MVAVWLLACASLLVTSSSAASVDIIEEVARSSTTLEPKYSGSPTGISWWLNGRILVDIHLQPQIRVYSYPKFSPFKDKTYIDHSSGRLTIRDLTEAESGYYRAEVMVDEKILVTHTRLIVLPQAREVLEAESGGSVTLQPKYSGDPSEISWWKATDILVDLQLKPSEHIGFYHFKGRAAIDKITGQLTITNLTKADSGLYRAEVLVDDRTQYSGIQLTVHG
ncbi:lymphocyte function-associated antigen 3 [Hyperolius riggenbachi]|uniref:lymphocyte function-associated antigen 3 n=1 Tax=Hyperolius riggenbachi TaxID=752182 RepID=UPI0035A2B204